MSITSDLSLSLTEKDLNSVFEKNSCWPEVSSILSKLTKAGFESFVVGGAVRDALLGVTPKDFDIATSATPDEALKIFPKAQEVGKAFGVIWIPLKKRQEEIHGIELATFRKDGDYKDGRHPTSVEFCSAKEDSQRRDFTINALYYDSKKKQIHDFVGGVKDLNDKLIRTVGQPQLRFKEDKLRLIRALRFFITLSLISKDFRIEDKTAECLRSLLPSITNIPQERVCDELEKIFKLKKWGYIFRCFSIFELFKHLFPKWPKLETLYFWKTDEHFILIDTDLNTNIQSKNQAYFGWILMFYPEAYRTVKEEQPCADFINNLKKSLQGIRASKSTIRSMTQFYSLLFNLINPKIPSVEKLRLIIEAEPVLPIYILESLIENMRFEKHFTSLKDQLLSEDQGITKIQFFEYCRKNQNKESLARLITGKDLLEQGLKPSPQIQKILDRLYEEQLINQYKTKAEVLKKLPAILKELKEKN